MIETNHKIQELETIEKQGDIYLIQKGLRRRKLTKTDIPNKELKESIDFSLKHNTVKERVLSILKSDKYARRNDFYLCLSYWVKCGMIKVNVDFNDFNAITKPESISRCRRELIKESKTNPKLRFLLNDIETLSKRENLENLNHDYYQDLNNSKYAEVLK